MSADETQIVRELSPGKLLLQGRLQAGLTQEFIARELYITLAKVKAIEVDDYGQLNTENFVRGYIRAYAILVKLNVAEVSAVYEQLIAERSRNVKNASLVGSPPTKAFYKGAWPFLAVVGAFFVGVWLISVWFFDNRSEINYVLPSSNLSSASANLDNLRLVPESSVGHYTEKSTDISAVETASDIEKNNLSTSSAGMSEQNSSSIGGRAINVDATSSSMQQEKMVPNKILNEPNDKVLVVENKKTNSDAREAALDEISFTFSAESWLEVSDSRGDVLATELQPVGSKISLVGRAPFNVKLGNAPAVTIQLNGQKIDVIPLMGSNVLTLKVGVNSLTTE